MNIIYICTISKEEHTEMLSFRRYISTSFVRYAKTTRRSHGGSNKIITKNNKNNRINIPPQAPIFNKNINRVTKEKETNIDKEDNKINLNFKWKEYIDSKEKIDNEIIIREILEKIIGFSEYSKIQTLEDNLWTLLKKRVVIYDNIFGPKEEEEIEGEVEVFQYPLNIKEGIIQCRDINDYENMVRIYDYYFQLLIKSPLMHDIDNREELIRIFGEIDENDNKYIEKIFKLIEELENSIKINKFGNKEESVKIFEDRIIEKIEKEWYKIKEPRNLKIYQYNYNKFLKILKNDLRFEFNGKFIDDYCRDLMKSEMKFEYEEIEIMIKNIIKFQKFDIKMYNKLNDIIRKEMGLIITPEIYKIFLRECLKNGNFENFEIIIEDFYEKDGFLIDKELIEILIIYYSKIGDFNKLIKIIKLEIIEFKIPLFKEDFKIIIESFIRIGMRSIGIDLIKSLMIILRGIKIEDNNEDKFKRDKDMESLRELNDGLLDLNMMNNTNGNDCLMIKPDIDHSLISGLLITCKTFKEYEKLFSEIYDEELIELSCELIKIDLLIKDKFGIYYEKDGFKKFQDSIVYGMERFSIEEIDKFVEDKETIEVIVKIIERFVEEKVVEGDNVAKHMGVLYGRLGKLDNGDNGDNDDSLERLRQQARDRNAGVLEAVLGVAQVELT